MFSCGHIRMRVIGNGLVVPPSAVGGASSEMGSPLTGGATLTENTGWDSGTLHPENVILIQLSSEKPPN